MTKQELLDYGFCFRSPDLNSMCLGCTRLDSDCDGSTNPVWTGCVHKKVSRADYAAKFKQLLELSDNLKTGHFGESETKFNEFGFELFSQVASMKVTFHPSTCNWRVRTYDNETDEEIIFTGEGWNNLIHYLCKDTDCTWFHYMTEEQIKECKL